MSFNGNTDKRDFHLTNVVSLLEVIVKPFQLLSV